MSFRLDYDAEGRPPEWRRPDRVPRLRWHHEAIRLEAQGYKQTEIARIVRRAQQTVNNFLNPDAGEASRRAQVAGQKRRYNTDPEWRARKLAKCAAYRASKRGAAR